MTTISTAVAKRAALGAIMLACCAMAGCPEASSPAVSAVVLAGTGGSARTIVIEPTGISFRTPRAAANIYVTAPDMAAVRTGGGAEWDTEYADVVNAVLPFERCVAAFGDDGWGTKGVSYADLQARVYVLDESPESAQKRIEAELPAAVRAVLTPARVRERNSHGEGPAVAKPAPSPGDDVPPATMKVPVAKSAADGWQRLAVAFDLRFGDYGSTANVDIRLRRFGGHTVAVALMYTSFASHEKDIRDLMESFHVEAAK